MGVKRLKIKDDQVAQTKEEYEPYGPEWEKEMMKLDKKTLIGMLKAKGLEESCHAI